MVMSWANHELMPGRSFLWPWIRWWYLLAFPLLDKAASKHITEVGYFTFHHSRKEVQKNANRSTWIRCKDYEIKASSSASMVKLSHISTLLLRLWKHLLSQRSCLWLSHVKGAKECECCTWLFLEGRQIDGGRKLYRHESSEWIDPSWTVCLRKLRKGRWALWALTQ